MFFKSSLVEEKLNISFVFMSYALINSLVYFVVQYQYIWASPVAQTEKNLPGRSRFYPWVGKIPWGRERLPTSVFLPGEFHGQRSLAGCSTWDSKKLDTPEWIIFSLSSVYLLSLNIGKLNNSIGERHFPRKLSLRTIHSNCTSSSNCETKWQLVMVIYI